MTGEHDRHADDVAAYALGALNELEAAAFERHLMRCEACARDLEAHRSVVEALPESVPVRRAPAELKERVMRASLAESPPEGTGVRSGRSRRRLARMPRRPAPAVAAAVVAAALAFGSYAVVSAGSGEGPRTVAAAVDRSRVPEARAELTTRGDLGVLRTTGLPALDDRVYVVWLDRGDGPVYASSFNVRPDGAGEAGVSDLERVERVMVTREGSAAVAGPSESPVLTVELG